MNSFRHTRTVFHRLLPRASSRWGTTFLELLAVVLILGILATIATNVYVGQTSRARIAKARATIRELSVAIARYELDLGVFPPSHTGTFDTGVDLFPDGTGLLHLALVHSLSGNAFVPASPLWDGPYIQFQAEELRQDPILGRTQILDPWLQPYQYIRASDYVALEGTEMFDDMTPIDPDPSLRDPRLPNPNPFAAAETFYNFSTFQLYSIGPNGTTLDQPFNGAEIDDIHNFGY